MKREFIVERQGRHFCLYAGLLDLAHARGLRSIDTELVQIPTSTNGQVAIVRALVTLLDEQGTERHFTGLGDAAPDNVAPAMRTCLLRLAETRAKARALRDAVNIGVAAFEELSEEDAVEGAPERGYMVNGGRTPRPAPRPRPAEEEPRRSSREPERRPEDKRSEEQAQAIQRMCVRLGLEPETAVKEHFSGSSLATLTNAQAGEMLRNLSARPVQRQPSLVRETGG